VVGNAQADTRPVQVHQISSDYLRTLGIALVEGRAFESSEVEAKRHLAVVNETFVRTRLDGRPALGRTFRIPRLAEAPFKMEDTAFEIVGVARDSLSFRSTGQVLPEIYLPYTLLAMAERLVVLTEGDARSASRAVLSQVYAIDASQPVMDLR